MPSLNPDKLLEKLLATARPQKQQNLRIVHESCAELHRLGSCDFSLATVGRVCEARGGLAQRTLYNATSSDFKALILAWKAFSLSSRGATKAQPSRYPETDNELVKKVTDPVLRALFGQIIAERDSLRGQVQVLKTNANVVIDRRTLPGYVNVTDSGQVVHVMSSVDLSDMEKQALANAISSEFLQQEGWSEGPDGEILNRRGRKLFDIGFANAIRKVLMS